MATLTSLFLVLSLASALSQKSPIWTAEMARKWYNHQAWLTGANFLPSTAVNQLEMWQAATFDTATIDRELGLAQDIGFNTLRVFLHHVAWQEDPAGFKARIGQFLVICHRRHIKPLFVFFDDCWNDTYQAGPQPAPHTGIHNSGWLQDPGAALYREPLLSDTLEAYVKDILTTFRHDRRILLWDLYNEPGHNHHLTESLALLKRVFEWARAVRPDQPVTAGLWIEIPLFREFNDFQLANSDVITYHSYGDSAEHLQRIDSLMPYGRPMICTEYMARKRNSRFCNIMPLLKARHIGAINWGLVTGKSNTRYAWDDPHPDGSEPALWFHDIFWSDGRPYDPAEIDCILSLRNDR